ncbi:MAG: Flp pilus assembly protein CpaB, partial [Deltaproteobacteria bacterium]|nr:Flp pilus assembly protein CpaB [Deltaproteobacteria bacterium]
EPEWVYAAATDMKVGTTLNQKNVKPTQIPRALITGSVITVRDVQNGTPMFGRQLALDIKEGDPILVQHILTKSGDQRLADAVQKKGRAVSIRVTPESSVHNWVEPGDRVDVIGVFRDPKLREMISVTMLQNVIVLATGRIGGQTNLRLLSENDRQYNTITVHVLPEAAEMLVLAQELGSLYLSLRNPEDTEIGGADERTSMTTLLTGERSKRISTTQSNIFKVEIIRAGRRAEFQKVP